MLLELLLRLPPPPLVIALIANCLHQIINNRYILEDRFGFRVQHVDWTRIMTDWRDEDCRRVGSSLATFLRKRKTGDAAIDAWRLHYAQLNILFEEVEGFREVSERSED